MAAEAGLTVDEVEFRRLMREQRERAREDSRSKKLGHHNSPVYRALRDLGPTEFLAYQA
jgi:alanyl-tRNA synthetase